MSFRASTVLYAPARLMIVTSPKVGSTTILAAFLKLEGFEAYAKNPRKFIGSKGRAEELFEKGLTFEDMVADKVVRVRQAHPDYTFVAVMRDPAQRLVSGYFNKTNRYCKRFAQHIYAWGKLRQLLEGPKGWNDINSRNRHMQTFLSIEDLVTGLERFGTEWDSHFSIQARMTGMDNVQYERVVLLEDLDEALPRVLAECGVSAESLAQLASIPRLNAVNGSSDFAATLSPDLLTRIKALYREDYNWLPESYG